MAETDYERGQIAERLAGHDRHFAAINGSLARLADLEAERVKGIHDLTLAVQRLGDQAEANAKTVITTAKALKDAEDARRSKSDQTWTPWQRLLAILAGLGTVTVIIGFILSK